MTRPATRERRERFIDDHDTMFAPQFHKALKRCMDRAGGFSFFTDEQIEQITAEIVRTERSSHSSMIRERCRHYRIEKVAEPVTVEAEAA